MFPRHPGNRIETSCRDPGADSVAQSPRRRACGNGHVAKLVNNAIAACNRLITYEAAAMGLKYGLSLADMNEIVNKNSGRNGASERILPVLANNGQTTNFQLGLMVKDIALASQIGLSSGAPLLIANMVRGLFQIGVNELGFTANLDEISHLMEQMAGIKFAGEHP